MVELYSKKEEQMLLKKLIRLNTMTTIISIISTFTGIIIWGLIWIPLPGTEYFYKTENVILTIIITVCFCLILLITSLILFILTVKNYSCLENGNTIGRILSLLSSTFLLILLFLMPIVSFIPGLLAVVSNYYLKKEGDQTDL